MHDQQDGTVAVDRGPMPFAITVRELALVMFYGATVRGLQVDPTFDGKEITLTEAERQARLMLNAGKLAYACQQAREAFTLLAEGARQARHTGRLDAEMLERLVAGEVRQLQEALTDANWTDRDINGESAPPAEPARPTMDDDTRELWRRFLQSGRDCNDLGIVNDDMLKGCKGRVYCKDRLWIEDTTEWKAQARREGRWYTLLGREPFQSNSLVAVEWRLFKYALAEELL